MSMLFSSDIDYLGKWFKARVELGVDDTIMLGKVNLNSGLVDWMQYSHREFDGVGVMAHALEANGYPQQEMPISRHQRPAWYKLIGSTLNIFGSQRPLSTQWKVKEPVADNSVMYPAWRVLSAKEKAGIDRYSKEQGVSTNAYLFWCLNKVVATSLIKSNSDFTWFYPTNMRGPFIKSNRYGNHSSGVYINSDSDIDLTAFSERCKDQLRENRHWGLLIQGHLGTLFGDRVVRRLYSQASTKRVYAGSYSALGKWPRSAAAIENEVWVICAPGSPSYPVSTGVIEWGESVTFCLKLHPSIVGGHKADLQRDTLDLWMEEVLAGV